MPFDQPTRNALAKMVGECRRLLTDDIRKQLQGTYGLQPDGNALAVDALGHLDERNREVARELREWQAHLAANEIGTDAKQLAAAFERMTRETAFTALNRLAALRLCEERAHVIECVRRGMASDGFQLFERLTGGAIGARGETYRLFLDRMFDELALDLGVLFDRRDPRSLVFPDEQCLEQVLALLTAPGLSHLWQEDETIGWIYQYFNDPEERKKMRDPKHGGSAAPRNSYELAVRNQFFTPRYVVEFLTDNTLGRIWYEMTQGQTRLKEQCRYLVRRPNEIFLKPGESASEQSKQDKLSQEELLRQPVHIPYRPLKDPRELRLLDPACGSMHFGLYAFDLFEVIYDEAWELEERFGAEAFSRPSGMNSLHESYASKDAFLRDVPRTIIEHNIHGIDIDPRCAQIAGLSLWLRAHKSWQRINLKSTDRPAIMRSNIVCAEPMPGEKELLREFVEREFPTEERPLFLGLLEAIFDKMQLVGDAGSLLRIEEEVRSDIAATKKLWSQGPTPRQTWLFPEAAPAEPRQMKLDLSGITDEQFWSRAEERIYAALRDYAGQAENGGGFRRRLFADDAAQGFAFIDLCRKRYDAVVMNPPFGEPAIASKDYIVAQYQRTKNDVYAAFVERWLKQLNVGARLGAITSRTGFFLSSFKKWREEVLLEAACPVALADLGMGVLDAAMVETAAYVLERRINDSMVCFRIVSQEDKGDALAEGIAKHRHEEVSDSVRVVNPEMFRNVPGTPFAYWASTSFLTLGSRFSNYEPTFGGVKVGVQTDDDFRFVRVFWEIPQLGGGGKASHDAALRSWIPFLKGDSASPFYDNISSVLFWGEEGRELKQFVTQVLKGGDWSRHVFNSEYYFRPGISWALRTARFAPSCVPAGCIPSVSRYLAVSDKQDALSVVALWNSSLVDSLCKLRMERHEHPKFIVGVIKTTPFPPLSQGDEARLAALARRAWSAKRSLDVAESTSHAFVVPALLIAKGDTLASSGISWCARVETAEAEVESVRTAIDEIAFPLFGLDEADRATLATTLISNSSNNDDGLATDNEPNEGETRFAADSHALSADVVAYALGSIFGRWDIRYATGEQPAPELPDPFAPLPVCPPGMLQGDDGLPLSPEAGRRLRTEGRYPLDVAWDGILVDDPEHPLDIERRIRTALAVLWGDRADAIEQETCTLLGVPTLREWFRRPAGFFADHLKRYSKSRRQAPIYWPLSTASGSYTLWIYYHRLTDQTLYALVNNFIQPKLNNLERDISRLRDEKRTKDLQAAVALQTELEDLKQELLTWAPRWKPNLNDGVLITACPLWKLFRLPKWRKDLEACWNELQGEEYEWAHLAYSLWPERVRKACKKDRSLAIAHGLEEICEVEPPKPKKARKGRGSKSDSGRQMDLGATEDAEDMDA